MGLGVGNGVCASDIPDVGKERTIAASTEPVVFEPSPASTKVNVYVASGSTPGKSQRIWDVVAVAY